MLYLLIFVVLLMAELIYFRIADKCNIIDKPNQRSSHFQRWCCVGEESSFWSVHGCGVVSMVSSIRGCWQR